MSFKVNEVKRNGSRFCMLLEDNDIKYRIFMDTCSQPIHSTYGTNVGYSVHWSRWYRGFVIMVDMDIPKTKTPTYESVVTLVEQLEVEVMWMDAIIDTSIDRGIDDAPLDQYDFPTLSDIVNYVHYITQKQIDIRNELRALGIIV